MTDKEYRFEKKRIEKLIKKWRTPLGLGWWNIQFTFEREEPELRGEHEYAPKDMNGNWIVVADTRVDPYYLRAFMRFFVLQTQSLKDDELEDTFLHECMHILLSPMHSKSTSKEEETVATKLAQAFVWVMNNGAALA